MTDFPSAEDGKETSPEISSPVHSRDVPFEYHLLFLPTLLCLAAFLIPVAQRLDAALRFPYQMDAEEGFVYYQAVELRDGKSIYHHLDHEPFLVGNYPPLFPWILSRMLTSRRFGLPLGRLVVAFSSFLIAWLLAYIVHGRTRRILPTLLAPLLFLITYEFHNWSAFCRVDLPALAFTLAGLGVFLNAQSHATTACSALLFVLAGYTRQTAILAPLACMGAMVLHDRRRMVWFLVPYLVAGLGTFLILNHRTGGEFYRHTVQYNRNLVDWHQWRLVMKNEIWHFYRAWITALIVGAACLGFAKFASRHDSGGSVGKGAWLNHARGTVGLYFALAALSLVSYAKAGSAPNYGLEPLAAASIMGMETLGRLLDWSGGARSWRRRWARLGVLFIGVGLLVHVTWLHGFELGKFQLRGLARDMFSSPNPSVLDRQRGNEALFIVETTDGEVMGEYPIFSILAGKAVTYEPFIMSRLAAEGMWDQEKINDQIRHRRYRLIITSQDLRGLERGEAPGRWTPMMAQTILDWYRPAGLIGGSDWRGLPQIYYFWIPMDAATRRKKAEEQFNVSGQSLDPGVQDLS